MHSELQDHYSSGRLLDKILAALTGLGKNLAELRSEDLASVDEFHVRGREASVELANRTSFWPGCRVLDVGCGIGGSARFLAAEYSCQVTGIDLTQEYVAVARALTDLVGLNDKISFCQADALEMPFAAGSFDVVWTQHVQMNIANKSAFYCEIARVTRPGGEFLFHDIFAGSGGSPHYPVPWAEDSTLSFLESSAEVERLLDEAGLMILDWMDFSQASLVWLKKAVSKFRQSQPSPLGTHLLMGSNALLKLENITRNLQEDRIVVYQGRARRR